jgi:acetoacetyl-CoA synthetase
MPGLGMDVQVFSEEGVRVTGEKGELVCAQPFPCMPIYFWGDEDNEKYERSYFKKFENVWCHGDFIETTTHKGFIIHGRSDATLNPGGVRIGTSEIYRQVEQVHEIMECFAIGQQFEHDERIILFVKLREGIALSGELIDKIKSQIKEHTSIRHVPAKIIEVPDIPKTKSGKIVELAVRDIIHGKEIKNKDALANPEALKFYENIEALRN